MSKLKPVNEGKVAIYGILSFMALWYGFFAGVEPYTWAIVIGTALFLLVELRLTERDIRREIREAAQEKQNTQSDKQETA